MENDHLLPWLPKRVGLQLQDSCYITTSHHPIITSHILRDKYEGLFFFPKILQLFAITYSKWIEIFSMDSTPFITTHLWKFIFSHQLCGIQEGKDAHCTRQSPLCRLWYLWTSFLTLFWRGLGSASPTIQMGIHWTGRRKSREHTLNHKTHIWKSPFQALPNQHLSTLSLNV